MGTAVIDIGKSNVKLTVLGGDGDAVFEARTPNNALPGPPYAHHDLDGIWHWLLESLRRAAGSCAVDAIVTTTHGATAVVMAGDRPALPALDYEQPLPEDTGAAYEALRGDFAETGSPSLPYGLNLGRQLYWLQTAWPEAFSEATDILTYPQYWTFRLTGERVGEVTSLGCHTDLWAPARRDYSHLVRERGWDRLMPDLAPAWQTVGTIGDEVAAATGLASSTRVINGIHDSNASYLAHLTTTEPPFTVVSSGTWVICMAAGGSLDGLRAEQDMLVNVDVHAHPVPCARFMGGREYAALAGHAPGSVQAEIADVASLVEQGILATPGFADQGGPFPGRMGGVTPHTPDSPALREALAALYTALVTDYCLDAVGAAGGIAVEGSLAGNRLFLQVLAALRRSQTVTASGDAAGTTAGAALLARGAPQPGERTASGEPVPALDLPELADYRTRWRARATVSPRRPRPAD